MAVNETIEAETAENNAEPRPNQVMPVSLDLKIPVLLRPQPKAMAGMAAPPANSNVCRS
jgi:hypothetical protein